MILVMGTQIPSEKPIFVSLTKIYGVNHTTSKMFCKKMGFSKSLKTNELDSEQIASLNVLISSSELILTHNLKKQKLAATKKLISIKSRRGLRKIEGFPIRGQRTHSNAKTAKKKLKN